MPGTKRWGVKQSYDGKRWNILYGDLVVDYRHSWSEAFRAAFRRATTQRLR